MKPDLITRQELAQELNSSLRSFAWAWYVLAAVVVGGALSQPSMSSLWLAVWVAGYALLNLYYQYRLPRCVHCRRGLQGITVATDRCGRCGFVAVIDPRPNTTGS